MIYLHGSDERSTRCGTTSAKLATEELKAGQQAPERPGSTKRSGHARARESEASLLKIIRRRRETGPDLPVDTSAPSATRTRDLFARRSFPLASDLSRPSSKTVPMVRAWP